MATLPELDPGAVAEIGSRLRANVRRAVKVDDDVVRDVLPADLIGTNVFDRREQRFEVHPGPVFATGPTLRERRAARRELRASRGLRSRLRLITAMPPGGPAAPPPAPG